MFEDQSGQARASVKSLKERVKVLWGKGNVHLFMCSIVCHYLYIIIIVIGFILVLVLLLLH